MGYYKKVYSSGKGWHSVPKSPGERVAVSSNSQSGHSMLSYRTTVDVEAVNKLLSELSMSDNEARKAIKGALRKSASVIRKQARSNFPDIRRARDLKKEINLAVYRNASGARVDMIDKRKPGSKAFVLKFFDAGAKERRPKNPRDKLGRKTHVYGSIPATWFFKNAVDSKKKEAENSLEQNILNMIKKVADKRK